MDDEKWPKKGPTAHGKTSGYSVEARLSQGRPKVIAGNALDMSWVKIAFVESDIGVPASHEPEARRFQLLPYNSAQALRWWLHASAGEISALETRLVCHTISYSYEIEQIKSLDVVSGPYWLQDKALKGKE